MMLHSLIDEYLLWCLEIKALQILRSYMNRHDIMSKILNIDIHLNIKYKFLEHFKGIITELEIEPYSSLIIVT